MSDFTDAVEAEARLIQRIRDDRTKLRRRATNYRDQRDEARAELVRAQRRLGEQRQRVLAALAELEEAGSDPAPLRVVQYALDAWGQK